MAGFLGPLFNAQQGHMDIEVWVEPFAGGAGAALALLDADEIGDAWLTEKNPAIAALWRTILGDGHDFADRITHTRPTLDTWHTAIATIAARDTGEHIPDPDLAYAALIVNRCSRSGIIAPNVGPMGGRSQSGEWTVGSRFNGAGLADRIRRIHEFGDRLRFTEGDAIATIRDLDGTVGAEAEMLIFVDPPYIREGPRLYAHGMVQDQHVQLADALHATPARWLLTYDDHPDVPDVLYRDYRVLAFEIAHTANRQRIDWEYAVLSDNLDLRHGIPTTDGMPQLLPRGTARWIRSEADLRQAAALPA